MKEISHTDIIKAFNDWILGKNNDYYPKLAMTYDHDGFMMFVVIDRISNEDGSTDYKAVIIQPETAIRRLNSMIGRYKYGVTRNAVHTPTFMEMDI